MPSGAVTVGGLVINLAAETSHLKTDMAEGARVVDAGAKAMINSMVGVTESSDRATDAGARLVRQLKDEIATFGMNNQELLQYKANLNGVGAEVQALLGRLDGMKNAQAGLSAETRALADAEAATTARIRDMVAASVAEVDAMNEAAAATRGAIAVQERATATGRSWAESQRLAALNMAGVTASMKAAQSGTTALSTETQKILDRYDPLGTKLRSLQADFAILRKEMGNSADPAVIKAFQGLEDEIAKTHALMSAAGVDGFGKMEEGAKKSALATAGAKQQLMVLGHEAITGNFSNMPGSFMVLAEQMHLTSAMLNPLTIGMVALAVAGVGVAVAMAQGHAEMVAMNNALLVTSNYAGTTRHDMDLLAERMTQTHEVTIGTAREIVLALTSSGRIGSDALDKIARMASDFAKSTGKSVDEIAPKMISLFTDPIKGAEELNSSMHFLTTTQIEHIAALERTGQTQAAQSELAKAAADHMPKQAENLGYVTKALLDQRDAWSKLIDKMKEWGKTRDQPDQKAQDLRDQISEYLASGLSRSHPAVKAVQAQLDALEPAVAKQKELTEAQKATAAANELQANSWNAIKAASTAYHIQELKDRLALIQQHKSEAGPDFEAQEAAKRDAIRKTNEEILAAQRSIGSIGRQLTQQDIANQQALREIEIRRLAEAIDAKFKLGTIDKREFDLQITNNALDENESKQQFERQMANVAGLTQAERKAHLNKLEQLQAERSLIEQKGAHAVDVDDKKVYDDTMKAINAAGDAAVKSLDSAIGKQREHNEAIGKTKEQIQLAAQARTDAATLDMEREAKAIDALLTQAELQGILVGQDRDFYAARLAYLNSEIAKRRELSGLFATGADLEAGAKAAAELDKYLDPEKAREFGNALKGSLGTAANAMIGLTAAMQKYGKEQDANDKARAAAQVLLKGTDEQRAKGLEALDEINRRSTREQLASYGNMASAAAGFFDEHSRGYQALMTVSQAFHAAELAMTMAELVPKAISAVLTQGTGDPYTAFGRMAAMGALVAGLGVAIGGMSGADTTTKDRQAAQGAGSVLGDKDAKSESLKKSLDLIEKNTYQDLAISSSMLDALRSIDSNIGHFASQLVRSTDISNPDVALKSGVSGANMGTVALAAGGFAAGAAVTLIGDILGPVGAVVGALASRIPAVQHLMTSIFGGKQSVSDSGFGMDPTSLAGILNGGAHAYQYADVKTSGGWFSSDKHSEQTNALGDSANQQFTAIISSMADGIKAAGEMLGLAGDDFTAKLDSFVVDIGHVSLKDLKGDELQKAVEAVFSKLGDDMAQFAVGGLQELQQVGEGYLETLVRVATEYKTIDVVFQSFGKTFGQVGMASIAARDRLVQLAGGLDKFTSQGEYFLKNFFSEKEQAAALRARVDPMLAQYGLSSSGEDASKMFRDFIVGLDTTTEEGAKAYTVLMGLAPAVKQLADSEKAALDERKSLQDELDQLTMTAAQLREKERAAVDVSNLALFDRVAALKAEKDTVEAAKSAASTLLGGVNDALSTLQRVTKTTTDSLTARITAEKALSDAVKSTLASMKVQGTELVDRASARAQVQAALAIAKASGVLPDAAALQKSFSVLSQDSASLFSNQQDYLRDFYSTQRDIADLGDMADSSLSVDQRQLDSLNKMLAAAQQQVDILKGIDVTGLTIAQALDGFKSAVGVAQANPVVGGTPALTGFYRDLLGRAPDQAGLQYWQGILAGGTSLDAIRSFFIGSDEYKDHQRNLGIPGFAIGGLFGGGLRMVGEDGPELEVTGPSRIFNAQETSGLMARLTSPAANADALAAAVDRLATTVERQQSVIQQQGATLEETRRQAKRMADTLDRVTRGGDKMVTTTEA